MVANHTPGPWVVSQDGTDIIARVDTPGAVVVASTHFWATPPTEEQRAVAHLIAAAPELLEELMVWVADCPDCPGGGAPCNRCDRAKALIAKARGK
jgi:microcystin degradation protein MlrC